MLSVSMVGSPSQSSSLFQSFKEWVTFIVYDVYDEVSLLGLLLTTYCHNLIFVLSIIIFSYNDISLHKCMLLYFLITIAIIVKY